MLLLAKIIPNADAVWYSEVCPTHMRYKVRIDPSTGKIVQVMHPGFTTDRDDQPYASNSEDETTSESHSIAHNHIATNEDQSRSPLLEGYNGNKRVLRSDRMWRNLGDLETDALVVHSNTMTYEGEEEIRVQLADEDPASLADQFLDRFRPADHSTDDLMGWIPRRFLQMMGNDESSADEADDLIYFHDTLQEGEFFVKPCLCESSRWTFLNEIEIPDSDYNGTSDALIKESPNSYGSFGQGINPSNLGQYPNGEYAYVPPGANSKQGQWDDLPLYLCNERAMYCGIPTDPIMPVKCYEQNMRDTIARNAWPLILLWYLGLAIICCCTVHGRTAGDYVQDRVSYFCKKFLCCFWEISYDFNDRMLHRMIADDERENRGRSQENVTPWFYSNQRRMFERSLLAQVQWIWRHQEFLREMERREQGLPPPQIKLRVKRFSMATTTQGSDGGGFLGSTVPPVAVTKTAAASPHLHSVCTATEATNATPRDNSRKGITASVGESDAAAMIPGKSSASPSAKMTPAVMSLVKTSNLARNKDNDRNDKDKDNETNSTEPEADSPPLETNSNGNNDDTDEPEFITLTLGPSAENDDDEHDLGQTAECGGDDCLCRTRSSESDPPHEIHHCKNDSDADSLEAPTCTICFCPFEDGDRIGDLPCRHEFHVECLKGWLQRKNACPLCNAPVGRPERADPQQGAASLDASQHSIGSLMQRIRVLQQQNRQRQQQQQQQQQPGGGEGEGGATTGGGQAPVAEVQRTYRVGMIGSISTADDIAATQTTFRDNRWFFSG